MVSRVKDIRLLPDFISIRDWIIVTIATIFTFGLYILLNMVLENETFVLRATCLPNQCFCEQVGSDYQKQISNSLSSLTFCFIAFYILIKSGFETFKNPKPKKNSVYFLSILYGITVLFIGIGSYFYHATLSFVGQFMDVAGMNLLANFILLTHIKFRYRIRESIFVYTYILLNLFSCYLIWYFPETRRILFAMILALSIFPLLPLGKSPEIKYYKYLVYSIFLQCLAFVIWTLDLKRIVCSPNSLLQGHAIWHILSALVCLLVYLFYERNFFGIEKKFE